MLTFVMRGRGYSSVVEHRLPKPGVGGSSPLTRSFLFIFLLFALGCAFPPQEPENGEKPPRTATRRTTPEQDTSSQKTSPSPLRERGTPPVGFKRYKVRAGDTLASIAKEYRTSVEVLREVNNLLGDEIYEGEILFVPRNDVAEYVEGESFSYPVRGKVVGRFGTLIDGAPCRGLEFAVRYGTEVRASRTGIVVFIADRLPGYGRAVIIRHGRYRTFYGFLSEVYVRVGSRIRKGEVIAKSGRSPYSKKERLRFRIYDGDTPVNPLLFLK